MLLKHEYVELTQMRLHGCNYKIAHEIAEKSYNWGLEIKKLREGGI